MKTNFLNAKKQPLRQIEEIAVFYRRQPVFHPPVKKRGKHFVCKPGGCKSSNYGAQLSRPTIETDIYCASTLITDFPKEVFRSGHPTQKPVSLLEYFIRTYTDEGDTVLDNCMGSGSTGVACMNTNRNFIGMELDSNYFHIAEERITKAKNG